MCLFPTEPAPRVAALARLCEQLGYDFLGVGDVQTLWRNTYVTLTLAATATTRIRLGPWVTNPVTRHPTVTASALLTLDEVSGGRMLLGIGVGDGAVRTIGHAPASLDALAAAVAEIAALARRDRAAPPFPIYWAAAGERSLEYGGRHGDGVIVSGWAVPDLLERARRHVEDGASAAGRVPGSVALIFNAAVAIGRERAAALAQAKPYVARALARASSQWLPDWTDEDQRRFRDRYDFGRHFRADHDLAALVPDHMVSKKAIAGTPEDCRRIVETVVAAGYGKIAIIPTGDIEESLRLFAGEVLAKL